MKPILIAAFLTLISPLPFAEATEEEPRIEAPVAAKAASRTPAVTRSLRVAPTAAVPRPKEAPSKTTPHAWTADLFSRPPPL